VYNKPGFLGCLGMLTHFSHVANPESDARYLEIAYHIESVIEVVQPDLAIVDTFFSQAVDACDRLGTEYIHLSPNAWKDVALAGQGLGAFTWPL
jgi:hypothetical protein